jgi:putative selenate reductase molybdopterin-binding subunit
MSEKRRQDSGNGAEKGVSSGTLRVVNQGVRKKDAMALVTGKPVFLEDITPDDALVVKVLRSPHASARITSIRTEKAKQVPGIEAVYTWEDVPQSRFTMAGQTWPEPSPYDRLILDRHVRYVGDPVAIVAGKDERCVDKALKLIRTEYEILPALLDFRKAKDSEILVHPEDSWRSLCPVGADNRRNLCASGRNEKGDVEKVLADCEVTVSGTYHVQAAQQAMMETFRTYCSIDQYGRLNVVSSTQIVFHVRRILSNALGIPQSKIRVSKARIGGGFGAKQTVVAEVFPAFVTWMTKKPSRMIFTRKESQTASSPRHEMEVTVRAGADRNGRIRALDVYTLSNTGAYGEHGPTTVGLSGTKSISLYGGLEAHRFAYDVVYTNVMSAGAYRGYGATQGIYAVETAVNELAEKLGMDPVRLREINMVRQGDTMTSYDSPQVTDSCALDRCVARVKGMIGWENKFTPEKRCRDMGNGKVRSVGVAMAMQGSGISGVDVGSASVKVNEDGSYTLSIGSADMGTGCDTILSQIAAECLMCPLEEISVIAADTDVSPYDSGSYASSTTYVTGKAVERTCRKLVEKITAEGASMLGIPREEAEFDGEYVYRTKSRQGDAPAEQRDKVSRGDIAHRAACGSNDALQVTESNSSPVSPPPFMAGIVEIELDRETGQVEILDYAAAVDCGTPINTHLARVQVEGGLVQGIGMTLCENIQYSEKGKLRNNSFMQYKIPTRLDMGKLRVVFESSYEPTGPFGAKSIGEIVINTPAPALVHAIANATGIWFHELPVTPEKIAMALRERERVSGREEKGRNS